MGSVAVSNFSAHDPMQFSAHNLMPLSPFLFLLFLLSASFLLFLSPVSHYQNDCIRNAHKRQLGGDRENRKDLKKEKKERVTKEGKR